MSHRIPIAAIGPAPTQTKATCPYCGTGCGVIIESTEDQILNVKGDPDHPANFGRLCTKGSTLHLTAAASVTQQTRLLQPTMRAERGQPLSSATWDEALTHVADRLAAIIERHGPESVGFYGSGQLLTEDYYVLNKLVKGLVGTNNLDTNSRLCMSSAVAGYKATLGADAPPACYDDFRHAQTLFIVGANTAYAHPILFRRIEDARQANPSLKLIVADPRKTETAEMADLFLPIRPGTDVALFHGLLHLMIQSKQVDQAYIDAHTEGFEVLRARVAAYDPDRVSEICGVPVEDLQQAAEWMGSHTPTLSLYCQGLNQSSRGTDKNAALINLHLATGQIGKPGAGPFSLTGQPNAMGGREVGGMANLLSAHRDLANPVHRQEVARLWDVADVPSAPGKTAVELFEAAARGEVKALWIACTNPAQSMPDQATVRKALETAELVIVQEAFGTTATCAFADVLLPATTWGEKDGTVTNSERRISRVRAAVKPPGQARHDWQIFRDVGRLLEARLPSRRPAGHQGGDSLFPYETPESVWNEHRESTRGRDLDITGLSYAMLERDGPQQWPLPSGQTQGAARLYVDGVFATATGRARFADVAFETVQDPVDAEHPYSLNTGRLRDQWHGMSRTGTLGRLFGHVSEPCIELSPQDMAREGWQSGQLLSVKSRRGQLIVPAQASDGVREGQAFIAMHWGQEYLSGRTAQGHVIAGVNALTNPAYCPKSKQPELKHAAVSLQAVDLPWRLLALAWVSADEALSLRERLKPWMGAVAHASCVPFGREPHERGQVGVLLRMGDHRPMAAADLQQLTGLFQLEGADVMRYDDPQGCQLRRVKLDRQGDNLTVRAFMLSGRIDSEAWLKPLLQDELSVQAYGNALLSPSATPPVAMASKGRQVCTCFNVTEPAIVEALMPCSGSPEERLASVQGQLKCGTNCGSCIPELKKIIKVHMAPLPA